MRTTDRSWMRDPREGSRPGEAIREPADPRYEYRTFTVPRDHGRAETARLLTEHAEYGRWELAQVRVYFGGHRKVWLRRRIIRVQRAR